MVSSIDEKLSNIENYLERIESKIDNFMGFENINEEERKELIKIKKEMDSGKFHNYEEIFE
jgi:predicted transcriptional regulator